MAVTTTGNKICNWSRHLLHVRPQQQANHKACAMAVLCPYVLSALLRPSDTQSLRLVLTARSSFPIRKDYPQVVWVRLGNKRLSTRYFIPFFKSSCLQSLHPSLFCLLANISPPWILQQNRVIYFLVLICFRDKAVIHLVPLARYLSGLWAQVFLEIASPP